MMNFETNKFNRSISENKNSVFCVALGNEVNRQGSWNKYEPECIR